LGQRLEHRVDQALATAALRDAAFALAVIVVLALLARGVARLAR
jgi:hypothetical protein